MTSYDYRHLPPDHTVVLTSAHEAMVVGRAFDQQATNLAKQGILAVYPSSQGQEACQVAAGLVLEPRDWLFPTYRDSVAIVTRGVAPEEVLTLFHGAWHCGYNPKTTRTAPHSTPLATHLAHAVGAAMAAKFDGDGSVTLALCGDGATSEGDFHEALNLAAVFQAPVVFLVQNNGYAISVPVTDQYRAESIAAKGVGYGLPAITVDGNCFRDVYKGLMEATQRARSGGGPTLIEAVTYRISPHTNSDDPSRYRTMEEEQEWRQRDPIDRVRGDLAMAGANLADLIERAETAAREMATRTRSGVAGLSVPDPMGLFDNVYARVTPTLWEQAHSLRAVLEEAG